jgi:hypothetical protein
MKYLLMICSIALALSCKKEPEEEIENDVITTIKLTVNDTTTGIPSADYFFRDLDGEGGNNPVTDTFLLQSNKYYEIQLDLSNERQTPAQSVTDEINANKEVHQLFYDASPSAFQNFMYKDFDANGKPVGLKISFNTQNSPASGTIEIVLRHFPNKNGANVSTGDITNAGGESEVEIDFPFKIQ